MKFIFFGTPKEATIVLDTLLARGFSPSLIVTAPDRPSGRGLQITESPVAVWAKEHSIETLKPETLRTEESLALIKEKVADTHLAIVFAYGKIIPQNILSLFTKGVLNIHPSILPLHRGPAPVEGAILSGDTATGVSIMVLDSEMDHGPILAQEKITIGEDETTPELLETLVRLGAEKLADILPDYIDGNISAKEQNHSIATYTNKISKANGELSFDDIKNQNTDSAQQTPIQLYRKYRAYSGWPGTFFFIHDRENTGSKTRVAIKKASYENNTFIVERVVPEGKKETDFKNLF